MKANYEMMSKAELERERDVEAKYIAMFEGREEYESDVEESYERLAAIDAALEAEERRSLLCAEGIVEEYRELKGKPFHELTEDEIEAHRRIPQSVFWKANAPVSREEQEALNLAHFAEQNDPIAVRMLREGV